MTDLLRKAFDEASRLPEKEQDALARVLLKEIKSERRWDQLFSKSQDLLGELADEALDEESQGVTEELRPEDP